MPPYLQPLALTQTWLFSLILTAVLNHLPASKQGLYHMIYTGLFALGLWLAAVIKFSLNVSAGSWLPVLKGICSPTMVPGTRVIRLNSNASIGLRNCDYEIMFYMFLTAAASIGASHQLHLGCNRAALVPAPAPARAPLTLREPPALARRTSSCPPHTHAHTQDQGIKQMPNQPPEMAEVQYWRDVASGMAWASIILCVIQLACGKWAARMATCAAVNLRLSTAEPCLD